MPKLMCKCGNCIPQGGIPNKDEFLFISDVEYDNFAGEVDAELLYLQMKSLFLCERCKRIWVYWNGFDNEPVPYIVDA